MENLSLSELEEIIKNKNYHPDTPQDLANLALGVYAALEANPTVDNAQTAQICFMELLAKVSTLDPVPARLREAIADKMLHALRDFPGLISEQEESLLTNLLQKTMKLASIELNNLKENNKNTKVPVIRRVVHDDWHNDFFETVLMYPWEIPENGNIPARIVEKEHDSNGNYSPVQTAPGGNDGGNNDYPPVQKAPGGGGGGNNNYPPVQTAPGGGGGNNNYPPVQTAPAAPGRNDGVDNIPPQYIDIHKLLAIAVLNSVAEKFVENEDGKYRLVLKNGIPEKTKHFEYGYDYEIPMDLEAPIHLYDISDPKGEIPDNLPILYYAAHYLTVLGAAPQIDEMGDILVEDFTIKIPLNHEDDSPSWQSVNLTNIFDQFALFRLSTGLTNLQLAAIRRSADDMIMPSYNNTDVKPTANGMQFGLDHTIYAADRFWDLNVRTRALYKHVLNPNTKPDHNMSYYNPIDRSRM